MEGIHIERRNKLFIGLIHSPTRFNRIFKIHRLYVDVINQEKDCVELQPLLNNFDKGTPFVDSLHKPGQSLSNGKYALIRISHA